MKKKTLIFLLSFIAAFSASAQANKILVLAEDGFNADEFWRPYFILKGAGLELTIASTELGTVAAGNKRRILDIEATQIFQSVNTSDYDALFIPGGYSPSKLIKIPAAVDVVKNFDQEKPIAAICHGPMLLAKAGLLKNKQATYLLEVKEKAPELWQKGDFGHYLDNPVVQSDNLIMSRYPEDAEQFGAAIVKQLNPEVIGNGESKKIALVGAFKEPRLRYAFKRGSIKAFDNVEVKQYSNLTPDVEADIVIMDLKESPTRRFYKDTLSTVLDKGVRVIAYGPAPLKDKRVIHHSVDAIEATFRHFFEKEGMRLKDYSKPALSSNAVGVLLSKGFDENDWEKSRLAFEMLGQNALPISKEGGAVQSKNGFMLHTLADSLLKKNLLKTIMLLPSFLPQKNPRNYSLEELEKLASNGSKIIVLGFATEQVFTEKRTETLQISAPEQLRWSFPKGVKWQETAFTQTATNFYTVQNHQGLGKLLFEKRDEFLKK